MHHHMIITKKNSLVINVYLIQINYYVIISNKINIKLKANNPILMTCFPDFDYYKLSMLELKLQ